MWAVAGRFAAATGRGPPGAVGRSGGWGEGQHDVRDARRGIGRGHPAHLLGDLPQRFRMLDLVEYPVSDGAWRERILSSLESCAAAQAVVHLTCIRVRNVEEKHRFRTDIILSWSESRIFGIIPHRKP